MRAFKWGIVWSFSQVALKQLEVKLKTSKKVYLKQLNLEAGSLAPGSFDAPWEKTLYSTSFESSH